MQFAVAPGRHYPTRKIEIRFNRGRKAKIGQQFDAIQGHKHKDQSAADNEQSLCRKPRNGEIISQAIRPHVKLVQSFGAVDMSDEPDVFALVPL